MTGDLRQADSVLTRSLELTDRSPDPSPFERAQIIGQQGVLRLALGHPREAEESLRQAIALVESIGLTNHDAALVARINLATSLADQGRREDALEAARGAVDRTGAVFGTENARTLMALAALAGCLTGVGLASDAESILR